MKDTLSTPTFVDQIEEFSRTLPKNNVPTWVSESREKSLNRVKHIGFPTRRDEEWKYTNISLALSRRYEFSSGQTEVKGEALQPYLLDNTVPIVIVNGIINNKLSSLKDLPKGVTFASLQEALRNSSAELKELFLNYKVEDESVFINLNKALSVDGVVIKIPAKTVVEKCIHVLHVVNSKQEILTVPRTVIISGESSEATILESYVSLSDETIYLTNALTDIFLAKNATLYYSKAQKESLKSYHVGNTRIWQERDSNFQGFSLVSGAAMTRNNLDVVLNGEGAQSFLNALYSVYGTQHVDNHTSVDHRVPNCMSNQLYKGILNGASRAVFNGKIFVRSIAQKTNSYQLNKNLLLGKDCRVDTKPQLEIFADDVKCTHGATIGQMNEEELFYLQTRAIGKQDATRMLARGFAEDVLNQIKNEAVHKKLTEYLQPSFEKL